MGQVQEFRRHLGNVLSTAIGKAPTANGSGRSISRLLADFPLAWLADDTWREPCDSVQDAENCLKALHWRPERFPVAARLLAKVPTTIRLRFPSPHNRDWAIQGEQPSPVLGAVSEDDIICDFIPSEQYLAGYADHTRIRFSSEPTALPIVLVVHELGPRMRAGSAIVRTLHRYGVSCAMMYLPGYGPRQLQQNNPGLVEAFQRGLCEVRRTRDALATLQGIDRDRIAIQGTSLGGFIACMASSLDPQAFCHNTLCLAGGDLSGILHSGNRDAREALEMLKQSGLHGSRLEAALWSVEPLRIAHRLRKASVALYSGRFDRVVRLPFAKRLASRIGEYCRQHVYPVGHYSGFFLIPKLVSDLKSLLTRP